MIYLDNSATTRPFDEVIEQMATMQKQTFGNPSSLHQAGVLAERAMTHAREQILAAFGGSEEGQFVFTAGGTEANNLAILGTMLSRIRRTPKIITSKFEHPSVAETVLYLKELGADCRFAEVDANGRVTGKKGGNAVITVTSAHNSSIKTEFKVTVTKRPVGITVTKPTKVLYALGDRFDTTGMVIEVIYDDNTKSKIPLTLATITGYSSDKLGEQYINVIYDGFYDSFIINVVEELPQEPAPANTGCVGSIDAMAFTLLPMLAGIALVAFKKREN